MSNTKKRRVRAVPQGQFDQFGVYLWEMPDGSYVADEDRNFLNIPSEYGDLSKIARLREFLRVEFGITEGKPVFMAGHRRVTDEEYAEQTDRLKEGLIPDDHDLPAYLESVRDSRS